MVDGFSEPVIDRRIGIFNAVANIVIGVTEVIVAAVIFVKMWQRKDVADIHQTAAGVGKRRIVKPGKGKIELFKTFLYIGAGIGIGDAWRQIAAI